MNWHTTATAAAAAAVAAVTGGTIEVVLSTVTTDGARYLRNYPIQYRLNVTAVIFYNIVFAVCLCHGNAHILILAFVRFCVS